MTPSRFVFEDTKPVISDEQLLDDLRDVARKLDVTALPQRLYRGNGRYSTTAIKNRFGSWNDAIVEAGLESAGRRDIPEADLFDNLRTVWIHLGRQPRKREMVRPISKYTHHPYVERYRGWLSAMKTFLVSSDRDDASGDTAALPPTSRRPRDPSLRLRFLVMRRDRFKCRHCGRSPANTPGVELHVDHVKPWSEGGSTTIENLQTLCSRCNLGKSNLGEESSV